MNAQLYDLRGRNRFSVTPAAVDGLLSDSSSTPDRVKKATVELDRFGREQNTVRAAHAGDAAGVIKASELHALHDRVLRDADR